MAVSDLTVLSVPVGHENPYYIRRLILYLELLGSISFLPYFYPSNGYKRNTCLTLSSETNMRKYWVKTSCLTVTFIVRSQYVHPTACNKYYHLQDSAPAHLFSFCVLSFVIPLYRYS